MKRTKKVVGLLAATALSIGAFTTVLADETITYVKVYEGSSNVNKSKEGTPAETTQEVYNGSNTVNKSKDGTPAENLEKVYDGSNTVNKSKEGTPAEDLTKVYDSSKSVGTSTQQEAAKIDKSYTDLAVTSKYYYSTSGVELGTYPVVTGADKLNERIASDLNKLYTGELVTADYPPFNATTGKSSIVQYPKGEFSVKFDKPVNFGRYAYVTLYVDYQEATAKLNPETITLTYYVDKDGMVETTRAIYEKAVTDAKKAEEDAKKAAEAAAAAAEEEAAQEIVLVPVRVLAEKLGYTVSWDAEAKAVVVSKDDFAVSFANDVNAYKVGDDVIELEVAPTLVDSVMHVPNTFFSKLLDVQLVLNEDGTVSLPEAK